MPTKKKKRVAIFIDGEFIPSFSGATNRFQHLSRALQENTDTEVIILLCDRGWSRPKDIMQEGFKTYLLHPTCFKDQILLKNILIKEKIDFLQFANLELAVSMGIPLANSINKHLIFEAHYDDGEFAKSVGVNKEDLFKIKKLQNIYGKFFDKVISVSEQDVDLLSKNLRIQKSSVVVIPSGINKDDFPNNCFSVKKKRIIFLGNNFFDVNLKAIKKIKESIYPKLKKHGYSFRIIGDISLSEKSALEDKQFEVTGKQEFLYNSFKDSTIALAPVTEGSGIRIKILNYLNAGIPVITTTQGARGFPDKQLLIIEDNIKKYPELILKLMKDSNCLKNLSKRGREYVIQKMSWEKIAKRVSKEYDSLLSNKCTPKENTLSDLSKLKFDEPAWIKEVIQKKRFQRNKPYTIKGKFLLFSKQAPMVASLDGMPCAGKTTFMEKYKKIHKDVIPIKELYIKPNKQNNFLSGDNSVQHYAKAEIKKRIDILSKSKEKNKILMDRSFLSTLAYYYAKSKTHKTNDYDVVSAFFRKNLNSIIIPDIFILLLISTGESTKRRKPLIEEHTEKTWTDKKFLKNLLYFYKSNLYKEFTKNKRIFILDSTNQSKEVMFNKVSGILKKFYE